MSEAEPAPCGGSWTRTELGFGTGPRIMVSGPFEIVDTRRKLDLVFVALQLTLRSDPTIEFSLTICKWEIATDRSKTHKREAGELYDGFSGILAGSDNLGSNNGLKREILISLAKKNMGWVRVNYKWRTSCPGLACAGDLIRDGIGQWLHGFIANLEVFFI
ncbi:hypothetical protein NC653_020419 [Populus alba x Populus x berolinensis]|uniref:Uncharacterized protein n=1 Tax=Populus alba x Populus x berolinensis TaxID=444605 RepID=A0AAD6MMR6_9ROSI|nr:hypothetical protein NC653_020419 [Populus alba x Populus x berolinensis]